MKNTSLAKAEINAAFPEINGKQLWLIVRMMKHARLRCRNNAALNNWLNAVFGDDFRFTTETKTRKNRYTGAPENYPGLVIRDKKNGEVVTSADEDEE